MSHSDIIEAAGEDSANDTGSVGLDGLSSHRAASSSSPASTYEHHSTQSIHPSISSSIYKHTYEQGRRYHYFRNGKYPFPNDDWEQNREDMNHAMVLELTHGRLVYAPIGSHPQKIIDLGTGTGIWAIEFGEKYPSAEVIGIDLSPIQPVWVPPNVRFIIDDIEDEWIVTTGKYDYVHMRNVMPYIHKTTKVLSRCYENLQPGGWVEICDFDGEVHCDDGTMPDDWPVKVFWDRLAEAMLLLGTNDDNSETVRDGSSLDIRISGRISPMLDAAGFVNLSVQLHKVPIGIWPADKTLRLVGVYMQQIMEDFLGGAALKPYQALGMRDDEIIAFMKTVHNALRDPSVHCYSNYYVWTAQKPLDAEA